MPYCSFQKASLTSSVLSLTCSDVKSNLRLTFSALLHYRCCSAGGMPAFWALICRPILQCQCPFNLIVLEANRSCARKLPSFRNYIASRNVSRKVWSMPACARYLFSAPDKLGALYCGVNDCGPTLPLCTEKHATTFVVCGTNILYKIPLTCGWMHYQDTLK